MSLSVIIPSRTASNLIPCVTAIQKLDPYVRVVVIDDGVERENGKTLPVYSSKWIYGVSPFIFSRAINQGIQVTKGDVLLLNDDAILTTPGGFSLMQTAANERPQYGIISATTNVTGNPAQRPQGIGLRDEARMVPFICVLIPRRTIEMVGLMDERYCIDYGCEDLDYCEAVRRAGLKIGIFDGCFVDHSSLRSTYRGDPHATKDYSQNYELYKKKWGIF